DDRLLEELEDARRRGPGDLLPGNVPDDRLAQLGAARPPKGTRLQVVDETTLFLKPLDALAADHEPAAVTTPGDEELAVRTPRGLLDVAVTLAGPLERVLALRVEHEHGQRRFAHEELVGQPVIRLAGEVPKPDLPLDLTGARVMRQL